MIVMRNDEKSSSNNTAISFIGFNEELVLPFIKKLSEYSINHFVLVSSYLKPDKEKRIKSSDILIKARELIQKSFTGSGIEEIQFRDIWNFYEYLKFLSQFGDRPLYVNVSAGPSTFSSAFPCISPFLSCSCCQL